MSKHFRLFHVNARMDFEPQGAHLLSTFSNHLFFVRVHKYYLSESKYGFRNIFFSKSFFCLQRCNYYRCKFGMQRCNDAITRDATARDAITRDAITRDAITRDATQDAKMQLLEMQ